VLRSLTNMGLPADRVTLSATSSSSVQADEVQVFVRWRRCGTPTVRAARSPHPTTAALRRAAVWYFTKS